MPESSGIAKHHRREHCDAAQPLVVVHGHTPECRVVEMGGCNVPHRLTRSGRLNLDAGSCDTGMVVGVQIERGRYRVLLAGVR